MSYTELTILTGASRGMGRAMAGQLLAPSRMLLCISRGLSDDLAREAAERRAGLIQWQQDLGDPLAAARRLAEWLAAHDASGLRRATLINNAGTVGRTAPLAQASLEDLSQAMRVGLEAPLLLSSAFLAGTRGWSQAERRVLNISSGLGRHAMASQAPYCASKAGMDHFSRALALEGVKVVSLAPGVIDTDMQAQLRSSEAALFPDRGRFEQLHATGALTSAEDAARAVLKWLEREDFGRTPVADVREA